MSAINRCVHLFDLSWHRKFSCTFSQCLVFEGVVSVSYSDNNEGTLFSFPAAGELLHKKVTLLHLHKDNSSSPIKNNFIIYFRTLTLKTETTVAHFKLFLVHCVFCIFSYCMVILWRWLKPNRSLTVVQLFYCKIRLNLSENKKKNCPLVQILQR